MSLKDEINRVLSDIKSKLHANDTFIALRTDNIFLPRTIRERTEKFYLFIDDFNKYFSFIPESLLESIQVKLSNLNQLLSYFENKKQSQEDLNSKLNEILNLINEFPVLTSSNFQQSSQPSLGEIFNLVKLVELEINTPFDFNIDEILKNSTISELDEIVKIFIDTHNKFLASGKISPAEIIKTYNIFSLTKSRLDNLRKLSSVEHLISNAEKIKEANDVGEAEKLYKAFKSEADSLVWTLRGYNLMIVIIFILIIGILCFTLYSINIDPDNWKTIPKVFYGVNFSILLFSSGLITYLVRERNRLVEHQNNCKIIYLELLALGPYTSLIKNEEKIDELKIHLADRFFIGKNNKSAENRNDDLIISKISELTKSLNEVKSLIK
ncbi:hypothetical protein C6N19_06545 [Acinetobacter pittii]|uniref:hypothetical protein n=1 Tax=Acinetobacter pittii TaxID=48296 RepID=UPI000D09794A|nr:hypothetical protein [Acinetobacter pittii]AVN17622.1 hypothetical protein C6N19_06545 [Acinetobacter pittii]RZH38544.1 hypothetical protein EXD94_15385 [Acinetobacter pittii]